MQKILSNLRKLCEKYNLIQNGDKVAVGLSGGKDSLTLLTALKEAEKYGFWNFQVIAISIDLTNGQSDYSHLKEYCQKIDVPLYIETSNVFEIVFDIRKEKNPCSLCAKMRRGLLNSKAKELGCNKVALGHHKDDLLETFIMSLTFEGRFYALSPNSFLSNTNLHAIRPLLYVDEEDIKAFSKDLPILKNICPKNGCTERETAKNLIKDLEKNYPDIRKYLFLALTNPNRNKLWEIK